MSKFDHLTESQFQTMVLNVVRALGCRAYHTHDSRKSEPGFPDLVIVGARGVLYRELKTATGKVRPEQQYWLAMLHAAGADVGIWRPKDWPHLADEIKALGSVTIRPPERTLR